MDTATGVVDNTETMGSDSYNANIPQFPFLPLELPLPIIEHILKFGEILLAGSRWLAERYFLLWLGNRLKGIASPSAIPLLTNKHASHVPVKLTATDRAKSSHNSTWLKIIASQ